MLPKNRTQKTTVPDFHQSLAWTAREIMWVTCRSQRTMNLQFFSPLPLALKKCFLFAFSLLLPSLFFPLFSSPSFSLQTYFNQNKTLNQSSVLTMCWVFSQQLVMLKLLAVIVGGEVELMWSVVTASLWMLAGVKQSWAADMLAVHQDVLPAAKKLKDTGLGL